jgi:hypothetical protein
MSDVNSSPDAMKTFALLCAAFLLGGLITFAADTYLASCRLKRRSTSSPERSKPSVRPATLNAPTRLDSSKRYGSH